MARPSTPSPPTGAAAPQPSPDDIRRRAFEIYNERKRAGKAGDATDDWVQAERELRTRTPQRR